MKFELKPETRAELIKAAQTLAALEYLRKHDPSSFKCRHCVEAFILDYIETAEREEEERKKAA